MKTEIPRCINIFVLKVHYILLGMIVVLMKTVHKIIILVVIPQVDGYKGVAVRVCQTCYSQHSKPEGDVVST